MRGRLLGIALLSGLMSAHALASFHTFRINELYSNADGTVQFVELKESFGLSGQNLWATHALTVTQGLQTHTLTFATNLPDTATGGRLVLVATPGFAAVAGVAPDYTIPAGFLFAGSGTVDFAGVDSVTYLALPADGKLSLDRNGVQQSNTPTNYAGITGAVVLAAPAPPVPVPSLSASLAVALIAVMLGLAVVTLRRRR